MTDAAEHRKHQQPVPGAHLYSKYMACRAKETKPTYLHIKHQNSKKPSIPYNNVLEQLSKFFIWQNKTTQSSITKTLCSLKHSNLSYFQHISSVINTFSKTQQNQYNL